MGDIVRDAGALRQPVRVAAVFRPWSLSDLVSRCDGGE
jgi:hypothetical protein